MLSINAMGGVMTNTVSTGCLCITVLWWKHSLFMRFCMIKLSEFRKGKYKSPHCVFVCKLIYLIRQKRKWVCESTSWHSVLDPGVCAVVGEYFCFTPQLSRGFAKKNIWVCETARFFLLPLAAEVSGGLAFATWSKDFRWQEEVVYPVHKKSPPLLKNQCWKRIRSLRWLRGGSQWIIRMPMGDPDGLSTRPSLATSETSPFPALPQCLARKSHTLGLWITVVFPSISSMQFWKGWSVWLTVKVLLWRTVSSTTVR